ncbi:hypothetical protein K1X13_10500 [Nocardioides sp. WL0053]|uniref:DUF11 domain-containing protein n=1 Tax=Nocardioides jiangsuensis TaxID=2866161 RepID=A0ABS7RNY4_9ACTN|nr:hypothetical protein [Nocardioides jiangsuensis]MBY9075247.1 hypothetical protein [Nocardioides jiangsuensis]
MRTLPARLGLLAATLAALLPLGFAGGAAAQSEPAAPAVEVRLDQDAATAGPGERISFESTVTNASELARTGLVAHLSILTTDPDVYVDPEDWSAQRTQYVDELAPGASTTLTWDVQAVTSGPLVLFVSVTGEAAGPVASSGPLDLTVGGQREVDSGQVLGLVLWTPAGVLALLGATLVRRRRHR